MLHILVKQFWKILECRGKTSIPLADLERNLDLYLPARRRGRVEDKGKAIDIGSRLP